MNLTTRIALSSAPLLATLSLFALFFASPVHAQELVKVLVAHPTVRPVPQPKTETHFGTGFFVSSNLIVTNNHIVDACAGPIQVGSPERKPHSAAIRAKDKVNDLALLRADMDTESAVIFHVRPKLGAQVATFGFPYSGLLSSSGNFTLGNIASLTGMGDDTRFLQMSTPAQPGNSGGPLLDMFGGIVGVVASQLNATKMMKVDDSIPQNINFAIQAPIVLNFLSVKGEVVPVI